MYGNAVNFLLGDQSMYSEAQIDWGGACNERAKTGCLDSHTSHRGCSVRSIANKCEYDVAPCIDFPNLHKAVS